MQGERKIVFTRPAKSLTETDSVDLVDSFLDDPGSRSLVLTESEFTELSVLLSEKTSSFGLWWVLYEEDWIQGNDNLIGLAESIRNVIHDDASIDKKHILNEIADMAEEAGSMNLPLIVPS